jgi:MYXO-CTERM domain-containing protein
MDAERRFSVDREVAFGSLALALLGAVMALARRRLRHSRS